ncbi:hypothetical protein [Chryseobacterium cheonjiense]|uniref:Transmembrane protein n=1 Tax=Chryseobacterium cheonjiense TaxID=2728845 RepID=A0A7Y0A3N0_9FLAO|nr:hypothetical protein [Chryseobacterium cheonjiense]NML56092.1 hypothetical protein [Chryseobacterium cheonjiense]
MEPKEIRDYHSLELLLVGSISFLGGGILEFFIWSANIWFILSLTFAFFNNFFISIITGIIALCISGSFIFWNTVLVSESGREAEIYSFEMGYFLWLASILFLTISSVYFKIKNNRPKSINSNGL